MIFMFYQNKRNALPIFSYSPKFCDYIHILWNKMLIGIKKEPDLGVIKSKQ